MNETMSILLATSLLTLGGIGLYMFKSSPSELESEEVLKEDQILNWWSSNENDVDNENNVENNEDKAYNYKNESIEEELEYRPRKRNTRTSKNRRYSTNSRRKY